MKLLSIAGLFLSAGCVAAQAPAPAGPAGAQPAAAPAAPPSAQAPALPDDKVVLTIGDRKITFAQFNQMVDAMPEQNREGARGAQRTQFANFLAQLMALAQEARRQKLDETPAYKAAFEFQIDNTLAGLEYAQIGKDSTPDEARLRQYYEEHQADYAEVRARHILVRFQGAQVPARAGQADITEADALTKILELRKRIVAGEDFAEVAQKESDDTASGAKGGDLGAFGRGQMIPVFEQAAFALQPGQLSDPVKSQFGYHLIKLESKDVKPFAEIRAGLENQLKQAQIQRAVDELVKKTPVVMDPAFFPPSPSK